MVVSGSRECPLTMMDAKSWDQEPATQNRSGGHAGLWWVTAARRNQRVTERSTRLERLQRDMRFPPHRMKTADGAVLAA